MTRTRRWASVAVATLLLLAGCGPAGPTELPDPAPTGPAPPVTFAASVVVESPALRISYKVVNDSDEELIVVSRMPAYTAGGRLVHDVNAVYVTGTFPAGRVQVAKRAFPKPEGMNFFTAPLTYGITLGPGHSDGETLTVPLPLTRRAPFGDDHGQGTIRLPDPITDVVFCVGVIRARDLPSTVSPPQGKDLRAPEGERVVAVEHDARVTAVQHLVCSDAVKL